MKKIINKLFEFLKSIFSNNINVKVENNNKYNMKNIKKSNITINDNGDIDEVRKNN